MQKGGTNGQCARGLSNIPPLKKNIVTCSICKFHWAQRRCHDIHITYSTLHVAWSILEPVLAVHMGAYAPWRLVIADGSNHVTAI